MLFLQRPRQARPPPTCWLPSSPFLREQHSPGQAWGWGLRWPGPIPSCGGRQGKATLELWPGGTVNGDTTWNTQDVTRGQWAAGAEGGAEPACPGAEGSALPGPQFHSLYQPKPREEVGRHLCSVRLCSGRGGGGHRLFGLSINCVLGKLPSSVQPGPQGSVLSGMV